MIQELLGGGGGFLGEGGGGGGGERKYSFHGVVLEGLLSSSTLPSSCPPATTPTASAASNPTTLVENLRCPRCDSPNTKFCYYNNYNLTQPRHFCKTCRRYWTKGGALRNVPIGGGCRKGKSTILSNTGRSVEGKAKGASSSSSSSSDVVKLYPGSGFGHDQQSVNPILWGSPQNSQLLALLRATPNPNPNPNPNSTSMSNFVNFKEEGEMIGSHVSSGSTVVTQALNARSLGLDPLSQVPVGLYSSFFRNNQYQPHYHPSHHPQQQPQENFSQGDAQNTGIQELYHRLKASIRYYPDNSSATVSNATPMPTSSTSMMEPTSIVGGEFNSWNPQSSWSDLPTPNGSFSLEN